MNWEDLNRDNIEEIKQLYCDYLEDNEKDNYKSNLLTFEQFLESKVYYCSRCGKYELIDLLKLDGELNLLCECCYDDLHEITGEEPNYDGHDEWLDHQNEII